MCQRVWDEFTGRRRALHHCKNLPHVSTQPCREALCNLGISPEPVRSISSEAAWRTGQL